MKRYATWLEYENASQQEQNVYWHEVMDIWQDNYEKEFSYYIKPDYEEEARGWCDDAPEMHRREFDLLNRHSKGLKMNIDELNGDSQWLRAADLKDKDGNFTKFRVRIEDWDVHEFKRQDGTANKQIILKFHGAQKKLGLNKINRETIASMYGKETEDWIGKEIVLMPSKTMNPAGAMVDCIRIEYESPKKAKAANGAPKAKLKPMFDDRNPPPDDKVPDDMNDEVPF